VTGNVALQERGRKSEEDRESLEEFRAREVCYKGIESE
jgi:hypothetical protein